MTTQLKRKREILNRLNLQIRKLENSYNWQETLALKSLKNFQYQIKSEVQTMSNLYKNELRSK